MHVREIDTIDPLDAALRLRALPRLAWLDARRSPEGEGRYSFLAANPVERMEARFGEHPFERFDEVASSVESHPELSLHEVPRWIGYIAYDAAWSTPTRGAPRFLRRDAPILVFHRYDAVVVVDHRSNRTWLVGDDRDACNRLAHALQNLVSPLGAICVGDPDIDPATTHRHAIEQALRYIAAGEIYQVNLARRWRASFEGEPLSLWSAMRDASHVPLGLFFDAGDHVVLAATMERFLRWSSMTHRLETRPIKGTIRRDSGHDLSNMLLEDPKERAEHSMIVDLMRNDLGRVAAVGSVQVEDALRVEPFTGLYHLVSTVACTTRDNVGLRDILEATFPPGSVTGTPKVRAVEIIEELEQHPRDVYCGAVGHIDRTGGLSLAVAIRTATIRDESVTYWAGGGIVEASVAENEVEETELKAQVFLNAAARSTC